MSVTTHTPVEISSKESAQIRALRQLVHEGPIKLVGAKGRRAELPGAVVGLLARFSRTCRPAKRYPSFPNTSN